MSLKVWLPLNGDLHNQGCTPFTISSIEATPTFTAGKIGQCYQRTNSNSQLTNGLRIEDNLIDLFGSTASIAVWVKPLNTHTHYNGTILSSGNWNAKRWAFGVSQDNTKVDVLCGSYNTYINCTVPVNEWTHLVSIYDNGTCTLYKNGTYIGQLTGQKAFETDATWTGICRETYAGGYFGFCGCINDLRIYDHALTAAEVKEISQGLVLHYKLDSGYNENTVNLAAGVIGYNYISKDVAQYATIIQGKTVYGNKIFTYSAYIKNTSDHPLAVRFNPYNAADTSYTAFNGNYVQPGQEGRSVVTVDITDTSKWNGKVILYIQNGNAGTIPTNKTFYIKEVQVEEKNHATPFTPNTRNNTIIQDSSGYNHNGTILNTVSISSDTPRYSYSTKLEAANSMINCGRGGMVTDSITVNMWIKSSAWANPVSCTEGGGWNFEASGDYFRFPVYVSGVGYKYGQSSTTKVQICNNQWHMLTGIYDRINQKIQIYVDGQLDNDYATGTSNNIGYHGSNCIWIGAEATGSNTTASNGMAGLFSDFRIYCTALTTADILQLYHTSAKIDNKKNLHAYELIENSPSIKINKRGQTLCNELQEGTAMKFYKTDSIIETHVLNEF